MIAGCCLSFSAASILTLAPMALRFAGIERLVQKPGALDLVGADWEADS